MSSRDQQLMTILHTLELRLLNNMREADPEDKRIDQVQQDNTEEFFKCMNQGKLTQVAEEVKLYLKMRITGKVVGEDI